MIGQHERELDEAKLRLQIATGDEQLADRLFDGIAAACHMSIARPAEAAKTIASCYFSGFVSDLDRLNIGARMPTVLELLPKGSSLADLEKALLQQVSICGRRG